MQIWLPKPLYAAFPYLSMLSGMSLGPASFSRIGMALGLVLIIYGGLRCLQRRSYS